MAISGRLGASMPGLWIPGALREAGTRFRYGRDDRGSRREMAKLPDNPPHRCATPGDPEALPAPEQIVVTSSA